MDRKIQFDIDPVMEWIRDAVKPYPKAAMFELAEEGYRSLFEQLIACMLSIRTYDEVSIVAARRLFSKARTAEEMLRLSSHEIDALISATTFHERKSAQILQISRRITEELDGNLPCDRELLMSFPGIGVKCAHLALAIACNQARISVDVHVHRITNRWGYVATKTPEETTLALEAILPQSYWVEINQLLVPFGKHICTGSAPKCSSCPVLPMCLQIGVGQHR